jgi:hypothetical protein
MMTKDDHRVRMESAALSNRQIWRYSFPILLQSLADDFVLPFFVIYLVRHLGVEPSAAAGIFGTSITVNIFLKIFIGRWIDHLDAIVSARIGMGATVILPAVLLLTDNLSILSIALIVSAAGASMFSMSIINILYAELTHAEARLAVSHVYAVGNFATMIPATFVVVTGVDILPALFILALSLGITSTVAFFLSFHVSVQSKKEDVSNDDQPFRWASLFVVLFIGISFSAIYPQWNSVVPVAIDGVRLFDKDVYPMLILANGSLVVLLQPLYRRLCRRYPTGEIALMGSISILIAYGILCFNHHTPWMLFFYMIMMTIGESTVAPAIVSYIGENAPKSRRSTWMGFYGATRISGGVSIAAGGWVLQEYGQSIYFYSTFALSIPLILSTTFLAFYSRTKNQLQ